MALFNITKRNSKPKYQEFEGMPGPLAKPQFHKLYIRGMYRDRVELIKEMVARLETAWNEKNALLWASAFADPCDYIDVWGKYHRDWSRERNAHLHTVGWNGTHQHSHATFTVEKLETVADMLAVVIIRCHIDYQLKGESFTQDNIITAVFEHHGVEWLIRNFHNTMVKKK